MIVRSREEWQRVRARGKQRFLLRYAVLQRGLPMAIVCAVAIEIYLGNPFPDALATLPFVGRFVFALAVFSLGGFFNAQLNWRLWERRYGSGSETA